LPLQELWTDAKLRLAEIVVDDVLPALEDFWEEIEGPVKTAVDGVTSWVKDDLIPTLGDLWEWFKEHILPELKKF
ncbi:MAG: hypothetical protein GWN07_09685, partial [Actinobacteria bacterium]|nr:DUF789 domain-containing protein [Actinomycetota bacterium]NIS30547.1 DUF789 domain-containing protein [Actinomycetota bacterium]NIU65757.1 DUF789 domain-containing protein [Actinomycetota bacterium]NIW27568.1 hypothetical protein [Actinomycetota bacterium]NIX20082.1 hypothetical protein [Actinomycetota bacterium]